MIHFSRSKILISCLALFLIVSFIHGYLYKNINEEKSDKSFEAVENVSAEMYVEENQVDKVEFLSWNEVDKYIFPRSTNAEVEDISTGKRFNIIRTMGDNHADCETVAEEDTRIMREVFGGFNWSKRPVILHIGGRRYAASMAGMPHAGVDDAPAFAVTGGLSGGYGYGQNLDTIKNNDMDGVFDVHFINSKRHMDGAITATEDVEHQKNIEYLRNIYE